MRRSTDQMKIPTPSNCPSLKSPSYEKPSHAHIPLPWSTPCKQRQDMPRQSLNAQHHIVKLTELAGLDSGFHIANLASRPQLPEFDGQTIVQQLLLQVSAIPSTSIRGSAFALQPTSPVGVILHLRLPMPRQDVAVSFHSVLARQCCDALATALALGILLSHSLKIQFLGWRMSAFCCGPPSRNVMS